jgi:hypothetical protein
VVTAEVTGLHACKPYVRRLIHLVPVKNATGLQELKLLAILCLIAIWGEKTMSC